MDSVKQVALPMWVGTAQFVEELKRTEKQTEVEFCLPDCLTWNIYLLPLVFLVLRTSDLDWNLHGRLSGSQASKLYPLAFLSPTCKLWDYSASIMM